MTTDENTYIDHSPAKGRAGMILAASIACLAPVAIKMGHTDPITIIVIFIFSIIIAIMSATCFHKTHITCTTDTFTIGDVQGIELHNYDIFVISTLDLKSSSDAIIFLHSESQSGIGIRLNQFNLSDNALNWIIANLEPHLSYVSRKDNRKLVKSLGTAFNSKNESEFAIQHAKHQNLFTTE